MICSTEWRFGSSWWRVVQDELAVAGDDGEQVVEVVRDAAGQHADGFHFLRLPELLLQLHPSGDIHQDGKLGGLAAVLDIVERDFDLDGTPRFGPMTHSDGNARRSIDVSRGSPLRIVRKLQIGTCIERSCSARIPVETGAAAFTSRMRWPSASRDPHRLWMLFKQEPELPVVLF